MQFGLFGLFDGHGGKAAAEHCVVGMGGGRCTLDPGLKAPPPCVSKYDCEKDIKQCFQQLGTLVSKMRCLHPLLRGGLPAGADCRARRGRPGAARPGSRGCFRGGSSASPRRVAAFHFPYSSRPFSHSFKHLQHNSSFPLSAHYPIPLSASTIRRPRYRIESFFTHFHGTFSSPGPT